MKYIAYTLRCDKCNVIVMQNHGSIRCPRCKATVFIQSYTTNGPWYCPGCHEMLSRDGTIRCDSCGYRNLICRVYETSGDNTTLTSYYRDILLLDLSGLQLRAYVEEADQIEKQRIGLENALATLDMGFDLDRFVEVFGSTPVVISEWSLRSHCGPFYFLRNVAPDQGDKTVQLTVTPRERRLDVSIGVRNSMNDIIMNDIILESFSYFADIEANMPQVTINGNVYGLQIRVAVSKQSMVIRCAKNLDSKFGKFSDSLHYLLQLKPLEKQEPVSKEKLYLPYIRR